MVRSFSLPGMIAHLKGTVVNQGVDNRPTGTHRTVVVRGVPPEVNEPLLMEFFKGYGQITAVNPKDDEEDTWLVTFRKNREATAALVEDGSILLGSQISVHRLEGRRTSMLQGRCMSFISAVLNLLNAIVGSGVLSLAFIMRGSGWALFICILLTMVVIVDYSLQLLVAAALTSKQGGEMLSYERLGAIAWGYKGRVMVSALIMVQNTGAMVSYFKVFKDIIGDIMTLFLSSDSLFANSNFMTFLAACFVYPIACSPTIGFLAYAGFVAIALTTLFVAFVAYKYTDYSCDGCTVHAFDPSLDTFLALPTLCFSFVCHTSLLPVYNELQEADELGRTRRPQKRMTLAIHCAMVVALLLYVVGALFGYLTFGGDTSQDLLTNYQDIGKKESFSIAVRVSFACAVLLSIPLILFPFRRAFENLISCLVDMNIDTGRFQCITKLEERQGATFWVYHLVQTFLIVMFMLGLALFVPHITTVFGAVGATSSVGLVFLLPAALYIKICLGETNLEIIREKGSLLTPGLLDEEPQEPQQLSYYGPRALFATGVVIFFVSWGGMIYRWSTGSS